MFFFFFYWRFHKGFLFLLELPLTTTWGNIKLKMLLFDFCLRLMFILFFVIKFRRYSHTETDLKWKAIAVRSYLIERKKKKKKKTTAQYFQSYVRLVYQYACITLVFLILTFFPSAILSVSTKVSEEVVCNKVRVIVKRWKPLVSYFRLQIF